MNTSTAIRQTGVALIGAGMIAERHVRALSALQPQARLKTIVSRRPERARRLAQWQKGPAPRCTDELGAVTQDPDVQVAIVATPPDARIELIEALAAAGKHVLVEKPLARSLDEARQVVEICERAGVQLGVLFQHRVREPSRVARQLLASGELGAPGLVDIAVPLWRDQSYYDEAGRGTYARDGGGVLLTQAIHTIDLALSLSGPVQRVQAMTATTSLHCMESEDFAVAGLRFSSGAVGSLVASTATFPHGRESITLHCKLGSVRIGIDTLEINWRDGRNELPVTPRETGSGQLAVEPRVAWHQAVISDFLDAVHKQRAPLVSGRVALESHRLIDAIEVSSRSGVAVDLDARAGS